MSTKTDLLPSRAALSQRLAALKEHPLWRLETALVAGAIVAGLISAGLSHQHSLAVSESMERLYKTTPVIVASRDLPAGTLIDQTAVTNLTTLDRSLSPNFVPARDEKLVLGYRLAVAVKRNDPILLSMVQGAADAAGIADKIPPGKRLFTLTITNKAAGYGFVNPNDHVDVIANIELPGRGLTTFTILQDVTLVSVGARSVLDDEVRQGGTDVSFFVAPEDFEMLSFAQKRGNFSLSLRNPKDVGMLSRTTPAGERVGIDIERFLDHGVIAEASGGGALTVTVEGETARKPGPLARKP